MNWPSNIVKTLVRGLGNLSPSCKEAIRLQSAALDRKLTLLERFGLRFHLVLCKWCRSYGRQITFLRSAAREPAQDDHIHRSRRCHLKPASVSNECCDPPRNKFCP